MLAYDAAHGVWVANTLALAPGVSRLSIHRSTNGLTWSGPIDATVAQSQDLVYERQLWPREEAKAFFAKRGEVLKVQLIDEKTEGQTEVS